MNKYRKGKKLERMFANFLEINGYIEVWRPPQVKWQTKDIFGLSDIIAISPSGKVEFFQIKSNKNDFITAKKKIKRWITEKFNGWIEDFGVFVAMRDEKKRNKGKYTETFTKEKNGITYTMIETTVVGRDYEILNFSREYKPGLKYPIIWENI